jgi:hypothetical protein
MLLQINPFEIRVVPPFVRLECFVPSLRRPDSVRNKAR